MRGKLLIISLLSILVGFLGISVFGQRTTARPVVYSVSPNNVKLKQGGQAVSFTLRGAQLDKLTGAQILWNNNPYGDLTASLGPASSTARSISIKALLSARVQCCYILRLKAGTTSIDVPSRTLRIEVAPRDDFTPEVQNPTQQILERPVFVSFNINDNNSETPTRRVRLNIVWDKATQYRASEKRSFTGVSWKILSGSMYYDLSDGNGTKTVYVQIRNAQRIESSVKSDSIMLNIPPVLEIFSITNHELRQNRDLPGDSYQWDIGYRQRTSKDPTHYRYSEKSDFSDTQWKPWPTRLMAPKIWIEKSGVGLRQVYFQVKTVDGDSNVKSSGFTVPQFKDFNVNAADAKRWARENNFKFFTLSENVTSKCEMEEDHQVITCKIPVGPVGSKCNYILFDGKELSSGWTFLRLRGICSGQAGVTGCKIENPPFNSRSMRIKVHIWADPMYWCTYTIRGFDLRGPGDGLPWEAFE